MHSSSLYVHTNYTHHFYANSQNDIGLCSKLFELFNGLFYINRHQCLGKCIGPISKTNAGGDSLRGDLTHMMSFCRFDKSCLLYPGRLGPSLFLSPSTLRHPHPDTPNHSLPLPIRPLFPDPTNPLLSSRPLYVMSFHQERTEKSFVFIQLSHL